MADSDFSDLIRQALAQQTAAPVPAACSEAERELARALVDDLATTAAAARIRATRLSHEALRTLACALAHLTDLHVRPVVSGAAQLVNRPNTRMSPEVRASLRQQAAEELATLREWERVHGVVSDELARELRTRLEGKR